MNKASCRKNSKVFKCGLTSTKMIRLPNDESRSSKKNKHGVKIHHRLRVSVSPVLTATGLVSVKMEINFDPTDSTPLNRSPKYFSEVITSATPTSVPNLAYILPLEALAQIG